MWTLSDAAAHWGLPLPLLERALHAGALRACWAGDRFLLRGEDVDAFVADDFHAGLLAARTGERSSFAVAAPPARPPVTAVVSLVA